MDTYHCITCNVTFDVNEFANHLCCETTSAIFQATGNNELNTPISASAHQDMNLQKDKEQLEVSSRNTFIQSGLEINSSEDFEASHEWFPKNYTELDKTPHSYSFEHVSETSERPLGNITEFASSSKALCKDDVKDSPLFADDSFQLDEPNSFQLDEP
ncbi:hypothetical protein NPIL_493031, partial [Nephila pilipes]